MTLRTIQTMVLVSLFTLPGSVFADDKASWDGLYGSVSLGRDWGHASEGDGVYNYQHYGQSNILLTNGRDSSLSGVNGNLKFGYNEIIESNLLGVEIGGTFQDAKANNGVMYTYNSAQTTDADAPLTTTKVPTYETIEARLGHIFNHDNLIYIKGGLAYGQIKRTLFEWEGDLFDRGVNAQAQTNKLGYSLGFGVEHKLSGKWALRADYEYVNFGHVNFSYSGFLSGYPASAEQSNSVNFSNLSVGLSYSFE